MSAQPSQRSSPPSALSNRRRRAPIACRLCRKRKIKCITDENPPHGPCERCTRKNLQCEYVPVGDEDMLSQPPHSPTSPLSNGSSSVPLHPTFPNQYSQETSRHDGGLHSQYGYSSNYLPAAGNQGHAVYGYDSNPYHSSPSQLDNYSSYAVPSGLASYPPTSGGMGTPENPHSSGMQNSYNQRPATYPAMSALDHRQQGWSGMSESRYMMGAAGNGVGPCRRCSSTFCSCGLQQRS